MRKAAGKPLPSIVEFNLVETLVATSDRNFISMLLQPSSSPAAESSMSSRTAEFAKSIQTEGWTSSGSGTSIFLDATSLYQAGTWGRVNEVAHEVI